MDGKRCELGGHLVSKLRRSIALDDEKAAVRCNGPAEGEHRRKLAFQIIVAFSKLNLIYAHNAIDHVLINC